MGELNSKIWVSNTSSPDPVGLMGCGAHWGHRGHSVVELRAHLVLAASPLHNGPQPGLPAKAFCTVKFAQKHLS